MTGQFELNTDPPAKATKVEVIQQEAVDRFHVAVVRAARAGKPLTLDADHVAILGHVVVQTVTPPPCATAEDWDTWRPPR